MLDSTFSTLFSLSFGSNIAPHVDAPLGGIVSWPDFLGFLEANVSPYLPGFTVSKVEGYWEGEAERTYRLEVIVPRGEETERARDILRTAAEAYSWVFLQDSVLFSESTVYVAFIGPGADRALEASALEAQEGERVAQTHDRLAREAQAGEAYTTIVSDSQGRKTVARRYEGETEGEARARAQGILEALEADVDISLEEAEEAGRQEAFRARCDAEAEAEEAFRARCDAQEAEARREVRVLGWKSARAEAEAEEAAWHVRAEDNGAPEGSGEYTLSAEEEENLPF